MIKYVELTAPEASAYRQAKILSIECNEGDWVKAGDTLFIVQSGNTKLDLPSTTEGRIVEFIVNEQQNITLSTPLLLLETEVQTRTASQPTHDDASKAPSGTTGNEVKHSRAADKAGSDKPKEANLPPRPDKKLGDKNDAKRNSVAGSSVSKPKAQKSTARDHQQQSLDLLAGLEEAPNSVGLNAGNTSNTQTSESNSMPETNSLTINVPDIGADSAKVIEILVKVGDQVGAEDPLVTLESDKASMDVPSPNAGRVLSISVLIDQDVSEGTALLELELDENDGTGEESTQNTQAVAEQKVTDKADKPTAKPAAASQAGLLLEVSIPDIGGDSARVVDILVAIGDEVSVEDALVTLESDKASMDVPSSAAGIIKSIEVNVDDDVSEGTVVVTLEAADASAETSATATSKPATDTAAPQKNENTPPQPSVATPSKATETAIERNVSDSESHASPSIRRFARELGVTLTQVSGTGRKNRITKDDVKAFVKRSLSQPASSVSPTTGGTGIPSVPAQDFSKFGEIEVAPLNKIKRLTAANVHRSWLNVPHVTHNDEANINDLESFRKQLNAEYKAQNKGIKLSPLAFIVKAVVNALQTYPQFNSSLEPGGENLILKKYFHIGIAVDTPNGLVVPVIRDADTKSVADIALEMGELAAKARDKKLTMQDMSGACFTISSLGGIGGTSFTPIVNTPEVAILGVSRSKVQPVWNGQEFAPGMMLPLSLSYDHRVIDGAEAARFARHVAALLEDIRRLTI